MNKEQKYLAVLENAIPYIFFTHPFFKRNEFRNARVEFINPSLANALGFPKQIDAPILNEKFETFLLEIFADPHAVKEYLETLETYGQLKDRDVLFQSKDGRRFWVQAHSKIIQSEDEFYIQGIFTNLERLKGLEQDLVKEKKTLEAILSGIGDAVCIYDQKCKIIFQSPTHRKLFGESAGEMCLYTPTRQKSLEESEEVTRWLEKKKDVRGRERFFEIIAFPIKDEKGDIFAGINIVRDITTHLELEAKNRELAQMKQTLEGQASFENMVGRSRAIQKVIEAIQVVAPLETTVLIQGETGTGKELVARALHNRSLRKEKPFLSVNCGAIPETLLESELFGHVQGAFTGAVSDKIGLFQAANGGTILLDEIGETTPSIQVKLLRVLQEGEIRRLGSIKEEKVDVRILAATNKDLKVLIQEGKFREDLFYRLHVFPILVPPLRERTEDIFLIAEHFLKLYSQINRKKVTAFSKTAQKMLLSYPWPGNVRELSNIVERAIILAKTKIVTPEELPLPSTPIQESLILTEDRPFKESLTEISRKKIQEVLNKNKGDKGKTAKELGISRSTLWRWLKK